MDKAEKIIFMKFTFYNIYIKTSTELNLKVGDNIFTFYNIYIKTKNIIM